MYIYVIYEGQTHRTWFFWRSMVVCSEQFRPEYSLKIKVILSNNPRKSLTWFIHAWLASTGNVETWYTCASNILDKSKNWLIEIWHQHHQFLWPTFTSLPKCSWHRSCFPKCLNLHKLMKSPCLQYFFWIYQISYHNRYTLKSAFPSSHRSRLELLVATGASKAILPSRPTPEWNRWCSCWKFMQNTHKLNIKHIYIYI